MSSKRATLEHCRCRKCSPPQEGIAFTTRTSANTSSLHKTILQLFKYEPCFGDFELDENIEICQIKPKKE